MILSSLPSEFYLEHPAAVARNLLGKLLTHRTGEGEVSVRICETEAYSPDDPASHSFNGRSERNRAMFNAGGCLYIYLIYGIHECLNIVTGRAGSGNAVLIRGGEPVKGIDLMWKRRFAGSPLPEWISNFPSSERPDGRILRLSRGPGNLCRSMGFSRKIHDGLILGSEGVFLEDDGYLPVAGDIKCSPRIGITKGADTLWRFFLAENYFVAPNP